MATIFSRLARLMRPASRQTDPPWSNWRTISWTAGDYVTVTGTGDWLAIRGPRSVLRIRRGSFDQLRHCLDATARMDSVLPVTRYTLKSGDTIYEVARQTYEFVIIRGKGLTLALPRELCGELSRWLGLVSQETLAPLERLGETLRFDYKNGRLSAIIVLSGSGTPPAPKPDVLFTLEIDPDLRRDLAGAFWEIVAGSRTEATINHRDAVLHVSPGPSALIMHTAKHIHHERVDRPLLAHLAACLECFY